MRILGKLLCRFRGYHLGQPHVDHEARRSYNICETCGLEYQEAWQVSIPLDWGGFCDEAHRCPLCLGWKRASWDRCGIEICTLNPDGPYKRQPDGGYKLDPGT